MLFNSFVFLFGFLPIALVVTYVLARLHRKGAALALTLLSLGFYAWWRPIHLPLLLFSIVFNYLVGGAIQSAVAQGRTKTGKTWLIFGLLVDVGLLGYFKYANFVVDNGNALMGTNYELGRIALPLAISFFTFQKIAYLVDSARGEAQRMRFLDFALFASFFPQLIAGPIVHYKEVVPQFRSPLFGRLIWRNLMIGLVIFALGLAKKTVIADTVADYVNPLYADVGGAGAVSFLGGWFAALSYTVQLYFDFSGYSDMAIGLARMFGIKLPLNFHSPLRARSIIDYWRRWHMTLQRFIVLYLFRPVALPLVRFAAERGLQGWAAFAVEVALPTFVTFIVSGIWHGAGWTFILWGAMHACYLCVNEIWRERDKRRRRAARKAKRTLAEPGAATLFGFHLLTLVAVIFGNVMFRAADVGDAVRVWSGMIGLGGLGDPASIPGFTAMALLAIVTGFLIIFLMPNTQQIMRRFDPAYNWKEWKDVGKPLISWTWRPSTAGLVFAGVTLFLGIMFIQRGQAIFLYFNF